MSVAGGGEAKIQAAAEKCLAFARADSDRSIGRIHEFLYLLKSSPDWSEAEIRDVTDRVLASLAQDAAAENPHAGIRHYKDRH